jgi:SNF2 family DNA or RNA helicase
MPLAPFAEVLTGATPVSGDQDEDEGLLLTREHIIDQFHATRDSAILIANPQAVGESISLHKACRTAIYFDRDFNCGRFIQSKDRIHRYSPDTGGEVTYHYLISTDSVDEQIDSRLVSKERRMQELVDSDEIPLFTESFGENEDDILSILEAYELRKTV